MLHSYAIQRLHAFHPIGSSRKCRFMIHPLVSPVRHHVSITVYKPRLKRNIVINYFWWTAALQDIIVHVVRVINKDSQRKKLRHFIELNCDIFVIRISPREKLLLIKNYILNKDHVCVIIVINCIAKTYRRNVSF